MQIKKCFFFINYCYFQIKIVNLYILLERCLSSHCKKFVCFFIRNSFFQFFFLLLPIFDKVVIMLILYWQKFIGINLQISFFF